MRIVLAGPASLDLLVSPSSDAPRSQGYPFPMTAWLAAEYLARGHHVTVVSTGTDLLEPQRHHAGRLSVVVLPARPRARDRALDFFAAERRALAREIVAADPDVTHAHWSYEFALAAMHSGCPTVVTVHDWAPQILRHMRDPYRFMRLLMQAACLAGHRGVTLTAPSTYVADLVRRTYRRPCLVVPNGVRPASSATQRPGSAGGRDLSVGLLNAGDSGFKNVRTVLKAWPLVLATVPHAQLLVAGEGFSDQSAIAGWAQAHGLDRGVTFQGKIPGTEVASWFAGLDVFVHPSLEESFGMVLVEAMVAGVPLIASRHAGAVADTVGDSGWLVDDAKDADAWGSSIIDLLASAEDRAELARSGRGRARIFDISTVADTYLQLLGEVACRR